MMKYILALLMAIPLIVSAHTLNILIDGGLTTYDVDAVDITEGEDSTTVSAITSGGGSTPIEGCTSPLYPAGVNKNTQTGLV